MGAPIGNQNAAGNPGGGRKSAYEEEAAAKEVVDAFLNGKTIGEIKEITRLMKLEGDDEEVLRWMDHSLVRSLRSDRILQCLLDKLLPSKIDQRRNPADAAFPMDEEKREALLSFVNAMKDGKKI